MIARRSSSMNHGPPKGVVLLPCHWLLGVVAALRGVRGPIQSHPLAAPQTPGASDTVPYCGAEETSAEEKQPPHGGREVSQKHADAAIAHVCAPVTYAENAGARLSFLRRADIGGMTGGGVENRSDFGHARSAAAGSGALPGRGRAHHSCRRH